MVRRQLGRQLRALREAAGKTRDDVAATRIVSRSKLEAIEFGRVSVRPGDVRELGLLYGASEAIIQTLREMALATAQEGWWQEYSGGLAQGFDTYLGLEAAACEMWVFEPFVIHGLLQTKEYARVVERGSAPDLDDDTIDRHVALRLGRQCNLFERRRPMRLHVILGEAALQLRVGSPTVTRAQMDKLSTLATRDYIEITVLPFAAGPHPALRGAFVVLDFDDPADPPVAYTDSYMGARYNDRPTQVEQHRRVYQAIHAHSVPIKECAA